MEIKVRLINESDLDNLRIWKNANKDAFFYKKNITKKQQADWFKEYLDRNKKEADFMYIAECDGVPVGCFGYRFIGGVIDIYNTILGNKDYIGKKIISSECKKLWKYLTDTYYADITVKVLNTNTDTVNWYRKNRWVVDDTFGEYVLLRYEGV